MLIHSSHANVANFLLTIHTFYFSVLSVGKSILVLLLAVGIAGNQQSI